MKSLKSILTEALQEQSEPTEVTYQDFQLSPQIKDVVLKVINKQQVDWKTTKQSTKESRFIKGGILALHFEDNKSMFVFFRGKDKNIPLAIVINNRPTQGDFTANFRNLDATKSVYKPYNALPSSQIEQFAKKNEFIIMKFNTDDSILIMDYYADVDKAADYLRDQYIKDFEI